MAGEGTALVLFLEVLTKRQKGNLFGVSIYPTREVFGCHVKVELWTIVAWNPIKKLANNWNRSLSNSAALNLVLPLGNHLEQTRQQIH